MSVRGGVDAATAAGMQVPPRAFLVGLGTAAAADREGGLRVTLDRDAVLIGRSERCGVAIDSPALSREHARLFPGDGMWGVEDLGSTNGVYVNGRKVARAWLRDGDELCFGNLRFRFGEAERREEVPAAGQGRRRALTAAAAVLLLTASLGLWLHDGRGSSGLLPIDRGGAAAAGPSPAAVPAGPLRSAPMADFEQILGHASRQIEVFRYRGNPAVLVIDFPGLDQQGRALNRIASLVEKRGAPRDRVVSFEELDRLIAGSDSNVATYAFGHDYRGEHLAAFFNLARDAAQPLSGEEGALLALLVGHGLLVERGGRFWASPGQALVSVPQLQPDDPATPHSELVEMATRRAILRHELSHGEFFTNAAYRDYVVAFWRHVMAEDEREAFRSFLARNGYDPADETLMINETQAYLVHTPDPRAFNAGMLGKSEEWLAGLRRRFMEGRPPSNLIEDAGGLAPR